MGSHRGPHCALSAGRLHVGDLLVLDGFRRQIVHVEKIGVRPSATGEPAGEVQLRISFLNGGTITAPAGQVFDVVSGAGRDA